MPPCCVVPKCSNRSSGHRIPKDPKVRKAWLVAIRRDKFVPTVHSRVCKQHFKEEDYVLPKDSVRATPQPILRNEAVPSVFAWSKVTSLASSRRAERAEKRFGYLSESSASQEKRMETLSGDDFGSLDLISTGTSEIPPNECDEVVVICEDVNFNIQNEVCIDLEASEVCTESSDGPLDLEPNAEESACVSDTVDGRNIEGTAHQESVGCNATLLAKTPHPHAMRISDYQNEEMWEELQFYTGFDSYPHFMFVFNLLGPAVNQLHYYSTYSLKGARINKCLLPEDQFFMTLLKLRRFYLNKELSYRFKVSKQNVSVVVITWLNFLYCQLKEINTWHSCDGLSKLMKLKGKDCDATVIIDCTEIRIVQPKNALSQQQCYSHYKGCTTVKVLVAMTPTGTISYVSEAYGGSISDRQLVEKCGFLNMLTSDDIVLADRGFNIQDLLASRNIKISIPDFVPANRGQLTPAQRKRSQKVASKRIHIERVIALGKTYNILKGPLSANLVPLASRVVFVCFMLSNLRSNIVM